MASSPPLDEIQYRRPDIIQWHVDQGGQPMDENMIHRYIAESPFFDHSTKNGLTIDQARTNLRAFQVAGDRKMFEDELRRRKGDEYMIVGEPQSVLGGGAGEKNGMWVIRKQHRDHVRSADGRLEEELTTLGTYFLVGENMYQAPCVGDVVGNRLTAATTSLSKFFDTAATLPSFSPTSGYSYLPASSSSSKPAASGSTSASPARSREGSIVPTAGTDTQSLRSTSQLPESHTGSTSHNTSDARATRLLELSFRDAIQFETEFMDENPLLGEPGSGNLKFTHTTAELKRRRRAEEEAAAAARAKEAQRAGSRVATPAKIEKAPSPPAVMTEAKAPAKDKDRKGSKMEKIKRKKSRVNSVVPGTPGGGTSAAATGAGS